MGKDMKVDGCYTLDNQMPSACDEKYLNMLKEIILSIVDTKKVMVFLFGSRVSGRHSSSADADIGLLADEKLPANLYHKIRNAIDESIIPWDVDIIFFPGDFVPWREILEKCKPIN